MRALFPYAQEAMIIRTRLHSVATWEIEFGVTKLPKYEVPEGYDSMGIFKQADVWTAWQSGIPRMTEP